ncbi:MAG: hypothetical protein AB1564_03675 [Chloroflexota bacterium]
MSHVLISLSVWLHALATVVFVGHYLLLASIYLPALSQNPTALSEISKRSRPWLYASLLIFIVTGTYLMLIDAGYLGFMNFSNSWGILMLMKHILILAMIAAGFWFNAILRVGPLLVSNTGTARAFGLMRLYANLMALAGVLVLLLTAFSQAQ